MSVHVAGVVAVLVLVAVVIVVVVVATCRRDARPWADGDYRLGHINFGLVHVAGDRVTFRQLKFLDSESSALQPMTWAPAGGGEDDSGEVVITLNGDTAVARISEDRATITGCPAHCFPKIYQVADPELI